MKFLEIIKSKSVATIHGRLKCFLCENICSFIGLLEDEPDGAATESSSNRGGIDRISSCQEFWNLEYVRLEYLHIL